MSLTRQNPARRHVALYDVSLRDGQHAVGHKLTAEQLFGYASRVDDVGLSVVEVGHGNGLAASSLLVGQAAVSDREMIRAVRRGLTRTRLGVFMLPGWGRVQDLDMAMGEGAENFRIASHCSESNLTFRYLEHVARSGHDAQGVLLMSHMASASELAESCRAMRESGASAVGIFDSSGHYLPDDVTERIGAIASSVDCPVIFHAHDNLGLSAANSLAAARAGAGVIDASCMGFGAGAGNARLELLTPLLEHAGFPTGADTYKLFEVASWVSDALVERTPYSDDIGIVSGLAGVFSGFRPHVIRAADRYGIDARDLFMELGRRRVVAGQEDQIELAAQDLRNRTETVDHG